MRIAPAAALAAILVLAQPGAGVLAQDQAPDQAARTAAEDAARTEALEQAKEAIRSKPLRKGGEAAPSGVKFLNKDTAVNRQDATMGTRTPKGTLSIGKDEAGDDAMNIIPPKKKTSQEPLPPIYVQPQVKTK